MQVIPEQRHVVVGVDGSPNSLAALHRAAAEARRRRARLDVVRVLPPDEAAGAPRLLRTAEQWLRLRGLVAREIPRAQHVTTRLRIAHGEPAKVLPGAAAGAELLVIGARGRSERDNPLGGDTVPWVLTRSPAEVVVCADHTEPE